MKSSRSPAAGWSASRESQAERMPPLPAASRRTSSSCDGVPRHPRDSAIWRDCCGETRSATAPIYNTARLLRAVASRSAARRRPMKITREPSGSRSAMARSRASESGSSVSASALSMMSVSDAYGAARSAQSDAAHVSVRLLFRAARPSLGSQIPPSSSAARRSASDSRAAPRIQRTGVPRREAHEATELLFP